MDWKEFFDIPRQCFEEVIGLRPTDLQKALHADTPVPAARYWRAVKEFAKNLDMRTLEGDSLHDVMFSVQLGLSLRKLSDANRLPGNLLRRLRQDKIGFDSTAFEPQVLSYLVDTGYVNADFTNDQGQPDLYIPELGMWIECKKLQSQEIGEKYLKTVEQNYRKAAEQIEKVGQGLIIIEIDNRNVSLVSEIHQLLQRIWTGEKKADHIHAVIITYWDRRPLYDVRNCQIYQVRRHAETISGLSNGRIPSFSGETFELINAPPIRQARYSVVARSDDWLKLTCHDISTDEWATWGPEQSTK